MIKLNPLVLKHIKKGPKICIKLLILMTYTTQIGDHFVTKQKGTQNLHLGDLCVCELTFQRENSFWYYACSMVFGVQYYLSNYFLVPCVLVIRKDANTTWFVHKCLLYSSPKPSHYYSKSLYHFHKAVRHTPFFAGSSNLHNLCLQNLYIVLLTPQFG